MNKETKNIEKKAIFYREGKKYYFNYNNKNYNCNNITINKLKEQLILPYKVEFIGLSRAQMGRVIADLLDKTTEFEIKRINNNNKLLNHEVLFIKKQKVIDAYKMPNINCLYGRSKKCNPYILSNIFGKVILLEVPKDYVKLNKVDYYFLASDLTITEKETFDTCCIKIKCDYIYNLNYNKANEIEKSYIRKLCKKIKG